MKSRKQQLVELIYDKRARDDEIDDAVMDLAEFNDADVVEILLKVANDFSFAEIIRASSGESLAEIWLRKSTIDFNQLNSLTDVALDEALALIKSKTRVWRQFLPSVDIARVRNPSPYFCST